MRKTLFVIAILIVALVGSVAGVYAQATPNGTGTHAWTRNDYGTITYKLTLNGDSARSLGHDYKSDSAIFTPWVPVPVGIPFWIYTEQADADSSKAFGPDTVHVGLFTSPSGGRAIDSLTKIKHQNKHQMLWDFGSLTWQAFNQQTFFSLQHADTLPLDTITQTTAYGKVAGVGGRSRLHNLGYLRFGMCMDDADSITDSGVRLNCYIVFAAPDKNVSFPKGSASHMIFDENSYGNLEPFESVVEIPEWAYVPKNEEN